MAERPCPQCGKQYPYEDEICPSCGFQVQAPPGQTAKTPWVAAALSLLFFGGGQVYNGQTKKGVILFFGTLIGIFLFLIPGILVLIYGMYDAYSTAARMNAGEIPALPITIGRLSLYLLIVILIYLVIGLVVATYAALFIYRIPGLP